jgi:hypothetical protein
MNKKMFLILGVMLVLIAVPLAAAAPQVAQTLAGNGDTLGTQDQQQLKTKDCTNDCVCDNSACAVQAQTQDQLQTQNRTCDCNGTCTENQLQTQTQNRECLQQQSAFGGNGSLAQNINCYSFQHQLRQRNTIP